MWNLLQKVNTEYIPDTLYGSRRIIDVFKKIFFCIVIATMLKLLQFLFEVTTALFLVYSE